MSQVQRLNIWAITRRHWQLLVIIGLYILLGGLYMWAMPPFEGPDEPQHLAYIEWLAEGKGFPPQGDAAWDTPLQQEAGQSPLYYLLASLPARLIDLESPRAEFRSNPYAFSGIGPPHLADNHNRALHDPGEVSQLAGGWLALYLSRAISLSFGILLLVSTYGLARQVAPDDPSVAIAAVLLLSVTPQVIFISSVISNDIPAAALSASMLWLLTRMVRLGLSSGRALEIGIAYGLAILIKSSAAALGPAIAVALAWFWLSRRNTFLQAFRAGLFLALGTFLSAGWWLIRSWSLYRSPLGLSTHDQTPWAIGDSEALVRFPMRWLDVFRSYWIALGWGTIRPEGEWVYFILLALAILALCGLTISLVSAKEHLGVRPIVKPIGIVILLLATIGVAISLELWMHRVIAPYGRLLFPALAAITVLLIIGWYTLDKRLPFIIGIAVFILALLSPFLLIRPAHALPEKLSDQAIEQLSSRLDLRFGLSPEEPVAILLSAEVQTRSMPAEQFLPVKLCWQPVSQTEQPYAILLHIIGPNNSLMAGRRTYPGLGHFPTTIWVPEHPFCDLVHVFIWEDLPKTLVYQIELAMLDPETGMRLPVFGPDDVAMKGMFVDRVRLESIVEPESFVDSEKNNDLGVQLLDFDVASTWSRGELNSLALEWVTYAPLAKDYQVFVHLRDPVSGEVVAQADGPPLDGWYPTSFWPPSQVIVDERTFPVPVDLPIGSYDLFVGLYDLESLEQISEANYLGSVEIEP